MEAIKRKAIKLREQVAKQQQALFRPLGFDTEAIIADVAEFSQHDQLQHLYSSNRAAKCFEKDIIHGIEGYILSSSKQLEIERRFAHDCCEYSGEDSCSTSPLAEAAVHIGVSRNVMVKEKGTLLEVFDEQVSKPLRALVKSAELEDARHLTQRYDRLVQEVESQATEVIRLRSKPVEGTKLEEHLTKLHVAEKRLDELKSRLMALGKEATSAMQSVEDQQQRMILQHLAVMVNAEKSFHRNVLTILEKLLGQLTRMENSTMQSTPEDAIQSHLHINNDFDGNKKHVVDQYHEDSFVAKVIIPFDAEAEGELSLSVDDSIVVQQVAPGGWSKGESNGKIGWFPSPYVEKVDEYSQGREINLK